MFHREGTATIIIALTLVTAVLIWTSMKPSLWAFILLFVLFILELIILWFFRNPDRTIKPNNNIVVAPCDGKVVTIEEVLEEEYFKSKVTMISIFMSPVNVHVNRNCVSGKVIYSKYHKGKYLVAWHPKSSTENERYTTVYQLNNEKILVRQIAGFLARRIVNYLDKGQTVVQGQEMGFIKFGSRVDIFLSQNANIEVEVGKKVKGNLDVIASYN